MSEQLWVKFKNYESFKIPTENCEDIDDFIQACKTELPRLLNYAELSISTTVDGPSLRADILLADISSQPGYSPNDDDHPLFLRVAYLELSKCLVILMSIVINILSVYHIVPRRERIDNILIQTAGAKFKFSDRDATMKAFIKCEFQRFLYFKVKAGDRNCHPMAFLVDGPGSGKTRFLLEIQNYLTNFPGDLIGYLNSILHCFHLDFPNCIDEFIETMSQASYINISFGHASPYLLTETDIEKAICWRILNENYENAWEYVHKYQGVVCLLEKTLKKVSNGRKCIVLGIDEINKIEDLSPSQFIQLLNILGGQSCLSEFLFIPVFAGTSIGSVARASCKSTHPPLYLPLPLLSIESSINIMREMNVNVDDQNLKSILLDIDGHCHGLELFYNAMNQYESMRESPNYWTSVRNALEDNLSSIYGYLESEAFAKAIVYSITRTPIDDYVVLDDNRVTVSNLREAGLIKLNYFGLAHVPFLFCSMAMKRHKYFGQFWVDMCAADFWWQDWKVFNCKYFTLRLACFAYLGIKYVELLTFYKGAIMKGENLRLAIPPADSIKPCEKINYRFPSTENARFPAGQFVINGDGEPFDGFGELEKDQTESERILQTLQTMHHNDDGTAKVNNDFVQSEYEKVSESIYSHLRDLDFVLVLLCRNKSDINLKSLTIGRVVIVCEENLESFYGGMLMRECERKSLVNQ